MAQHDLGVMYAEGTGVGQNNAEAAKWFRLAAEQGNGMSQFYLGLRYARGIGVPQSEEEARKWLQLAAKQGIRGSNSRFLRD